MPVGLRFSPEEGAAAFPGPCVDSVLIGLFGFIGTIILFGLFRYGLYYSPVPSFLKSRSIERQVLLLLCQGRHRGACLYPYGGGRSWFAFDKVNFVIQSDWHNHSHENKMVQAFRLVLYSGFGSRRSRVLARSAILHHRFHSS